jgi:hypothetical protein
MVIAGVVLIVLSVIGGIAAFSYLVSSFGFYDDEDVAIDGPTDRLVPGTIEFSVLEPLDAGEDGDMTVGIALSAVPTPEPTCTISDDAGDEVAMSQPRPDDELYDWDGLYYDYELVSTTRLAPGDYEASCELEGEPSSASGVSFTVGRVLGIDDFMGDMGPAFGSLGGMGLAALLFVLGLILLIIGLVQRSRSKQPPYTAGPYPGPYPGAYPGPYGQPGQYPPPGQYGQPGQYPPQDPYGQHGVPGGYPPPAPYGQPGPVAPTPPAAPAPAPPTPAPPSPAPPTESAPPSGPPVSGPPPEDGSVGGWTVPPSKQ